MYFEGYCLTPLPTEVLGCVRGFAYHPFAEARDLRWLAIAAAEGDAADERLRDLHRQHEEVQRQRDRLIEHGEDDLNMLRYRIQHLRYQRFRFANSHEENDDYDARIASLHRTMDGLVASLESRLRRNSERCSPKSPASRA